MTDITSSVTVNYIDAIKHRTSFIVVERHRHAASAAVYIVPLLSIIL